MAESYYGLLGLHPSASAREIRQAYRDLSKLYHPDTTTLPTAIATLKFQQLNEAYATLSSPDRRNTYDRKIGYSSVAVVQPLPSLHRSSSPKRTYTSSAYLDPTDRPLSPGEIFALFILGLTFVGCLCLAIAIGLTRGDTIPQTATIQKDVIQPTMQQPLERQQTPSPVPPKAMAPSASLSVQQPPIPPKAESHSSPKLEASS
ncbi:MAG: J domain-containing protein [Oscillatoriales cyanobacterium C42_A2020_001]|nr:J domain-containing protein [Leptolyngbyaceae cyanobacterium C42_A2020_001]